MSVRIVRGLYVPVGQRRDRLATNQIMGVRVAPGMLYLRSIMEECNGLLNRRLQVRVLSQILIGISEEILVAPALRVWYGSVAELADCGSPLRS